MNLTNDEMRILARAFAIATDDLMVTADKHEKYIAAMKSLTEKFSREVWQHQFPKSIAEMLAEMAERERLL